ncbi:cobalamin-independent synthase, catalytic domain-containing protein [Ditylenchus destructor]|nr:cobalamin-independent synthase, catalytic domain-containing protein [Ditylenchus destructor]
MPADSGKVLSSILGFSRMGPNRELKKRVEAFWKEAAGATPDYAAFENDVKDLQVQRWKALQATGLDLIPSGDYALYDHVLDTAFLFNVIPQKYQNLEKTPSVRTYFAMGRGLQEKGGVDVPALPMKKWFDTNYHYIVPTVAADQTFSVTTNKPLNDFKLAKSSLNIVTKPVLVGPISFLHMSHVQGAENCHKAQLKHLDALLAQYTKVVASLAEAGAQYIQVDEPIYGLNFESDEESVFYHDAFKRSAAAIQQAAGKAHVIFTTFFNGIVSSGNLPIVRNLPANSGIHIDLVRAPEQLEPVLEALPQTALVSLGLVDGRNIWLTPLQQASETARKVVQKLGASRVIVSTSCSLLHVPFSTQGEKLGVKQGIDAAKVLNWLAFGIQKIEQVVVVAKAVSSAEPAADVKAAIERNNQLLKDHSVSTIIHNQAVKQRVTKIGTDGVDKYYRQTQFVKRNEAQQARLKLPLIPTSTIGSFPQTAEVRSVRLSYKQGKISQKEYMDFIKAETERCIRIQEEIGLDILVHGEFERNDMVEFFGDYLNGYLVTSNGWVQSYGSRCVKPPVLFGDIERISPMTVDMITYAQSLSSRPLKGMLTGPTTILKWSFVRNDQPLRDTVLQLALAIRDEVADLDKAGIKVIQVDEPGFREGLPLDKAQHNEYLTTTVQAFKISTGSVQDSTQIQSHMCYSDFGDIYTHIAELDADVLCIECSRSDLDLLECFDRFGYPLNIGPGLYDIHSPRVPGHQELKDRLLQMIKYIPASRFYANPDCGLKTRAWPETKAALQVMVDVVREIRKELAAKGTA